MSLKFSIYYVLAALALAGSSMAITPVTEEALAVRGGNIEKIYAATCCAQGALDYLSPKTVNKLYNCDLSDSVSSFLQTFVGANQAGTAIALYSTIFADVPALTAIGYGLVPGLLSIVKGLLDGVPQELGLSMPMQVVNLGIQAYVTKTLLDGADNAATVLKYFLMYIGVATGQCRVAPQSALKAWGFPEGTKLQSFATKLLGQSGLAFATVSYTLGVEGADATTAVGRVALVFLASIVGFLLSGDFKDIGVDVNKCYPWIALSAATAAMTLM